MKQPELRLAAVFAACLTAVGAGFSPPVRGPAEAGPYVWSQTSSRTPQADGIRDPAWSPDGKRLAVSRLEAIWTMTSDGRDAKRVVTKPEGWVSERDPAWSPDGRSIAFSADTSGEFDVWIAPA